MTQASAIPKINPTKPLFTGGGVTPWVDPEALSPSENSNLARKLLEEVLWDAYGTSTVAEQMAEQHTTDQKAAHLWHKVQRDTARTAHHAEQLLVILEHLSRRQDA